MTVVDEVYALITKRDLAALFPAYKTAKAALSSTEDSATRLALHEAITDSLDGLLTELGEHGLQNLGLLRIDPQEIELGTWVEDCAASWQEVTRLRETGVTSSGLINAYVGDWMDPIGSRDWMNRMRLGIAHYRKAGWLERISARIRPSSA